MYVYILIIKYLIISVEKQKISNKKQLALIQRLRSIVVVDSCL